MSSYQTTKRFPGGSFISRRRRLQRALAVGAAGLAVALGFASPAAGVAPTAPAMSDVAAEVAIPASDTYTPPVPQDLSALTWSAAFDALHTKIEREYAFSQWKHIDWAELYRKYEPRIAVAEGGNDRTAYYLALRDYAHELHDGHVSVTDDAAVLAEEAGGSFGLTLARLDNGSVIVTWVAPGGPAELAGIRVGARVWAWGGLPISLALAATPTTLGPSQPTLARSMYEQTRFLVRAPEGTRTRVLFQNPDSQTTAVALDATVDDFETLVRTSDESVIKKSGWPQKMVEHEILPGNIGYVRVLAEIDLPDSLPGDHTPTLEQFRTAISEFTGAGVTGVVVDIRSNSGGSDQMVADMMASFYSRDSFYEYQNYVVPETGEFEIWVSDETTGEYGKPGEGIWIRPGVPRYTGPVVALVNNGTISSGEGLAMAIKRLPQGRVVGFAGTNGSFGMAGDGVLMPGGFAVQWPFGQSLDAREIVQIDSRFGFGGVMPTDYVPMTSSNAIDRAAGRDVEIDYALRVLDRMAKKPTVPGAPATVHTTAGMGQVALTWTPPTDTGGLPIIRYTATASPGGASCTTWVGVDADPLGCTVTGLTNATAYTFSVTAHNGRGTGPVANVGPVSPGAAIVPVTPVRIADTRPDQPVSFPTNKLPLSAGATLEIPVAGSNGIPTDAGGVSLNVTAVNPAGPGYLTVFPCGTPVPTTSNLNFTGGQIVPNAVLTGVGTGGRVCVYASFTTDVVVDLNGWLPVGAGFAAQTPVRVADTRPPSTFAPIAAGGTLEVPVAGRYGVPGDAAAVSLNVTAVGPEAPGFLTVYPCGQPLPTSSNLNYTAGQIVPNSVLAPIGADGKICVYAQQATNVIVDLSGWFAAAPGFTAITPVRAADTRAGAPVAFPNPKQRLQAGSTLEVPVGSQFGVPANAGAVSLNVTAVGPGAPGFLTVYPCGQPRPNSSNLNYTTGQIVPNAVVSGVGTGGKVCIFSQQTTDVVVDLNAWTPAN